TSSARGYMRQHHAFPTRRSSDLSRKYGRPPIDPVVLVKYLLVGYLYGIPSERQIEQRIQTDVALRWYLGIDLLERVPDHSTISRSEEHTSELQSRFDLVCRLLLE